MSHAWMPMYWGDYFKNTGHLNTEQHGAYLLLIAHCWEHGVIPGTDGERAAIAKLPSARWVKIKAPIMRFFNDDGTHQRVTKELARTEKAIMQRSLAGKEGGKRSAISRAIKRGQAIADTQAELKRDAKRNSSDRFNPVQAEPQAETQLPRTNHQVSKITTTSSVAAREEVSEPDSTAGLLATALPAGALARPPSTEPVPLRKPVHQMSRAEIDHQIFLRNLSKPMQCPCCVRQASAGIRPRKSA